MHLHIAERIQAHPELNAAVRAQVVAAWPSFYLGSVAPDFQDITDIPREATHFYSLPPDINSQAQAVMLAQYPELAQASRLPLPQAVFVAAYMAHLMLDVRWFREVLAPFFVFNTAWDGVGRFERFTAHNTLLTYLDRLALTALPDSAESTLAAAPTAAMAAFIPADDLRRWQQYIVEQLVPGAPVRTIEIYARRLHMSPADFGRNLDDPAWMEEQLFRRVPLAQVQAILTSAVDESVELITAYLSR